LSTILVTGAAGFIGRNLVRHLLAAGETVVAVDRATIGDIDAGSPPRFVEEACDAADAAQLTRLLETHRPGVVISLAEGLHGPLSEAVADSAAAQAALFKTALGAGVRRVVLASSITVYMGLEGPFHEDAPLPIASELHIGAMKKASEVLALWYDQVTPLEVVSLRLANIYGPRYHSMMNTPSRYLFEALGRPAGEGKPPLDPEIYRGVADFCHVDDCCEAILRVAQAPTLAHRIYNVGGGAGVTDLDIRHAVDQAVGRNTALEPGETSRNFMDISRIRDELGFAPRYDLTDGMRAYREWLDEHPL